MLCAGAPDSEGSRGYECDRGPVDNHEGGEGHNRDSGEVMTMRAMKVTLVGGRESRVTTMRGV